MRYQATLAWLSRLSSPMLAPLAQRSLRSLTKSHRLTSPSCRPTALTFRSSLAPSAQHPLPRTMSSSAMTVNDRFLADKNPPVCSLNIANAFSALTKEEKLYSLHMADAAWAGGRIILRQSSPESEAIFDAIIATFSASADPKKLASIDGIKSRAMIDDAEFDAVLAYVAQVLSNLSNFRSFGGTKFIPRASLESFDAVVAASERSEVALPLWKAVREQVYAAEDEKKLLIGKPGEGHTTAYYFGNPTDAEVDEVQNLCDAASISTLNTRLAKDADGALTLLVASASELPAHWPKELISKKLNFTLKIKGGDYAECLAKVNAALAKAAKHAENANRAAMLADYQTSFATGSYDDHDEGSKKWTRDIGPPVETYIGFIENYVDPWCARAEWEGFVAIVNKEQSKKFGALVAGAEGFVATLPWGKDYENATFHSPDFTALEVLNFATGGIPAGINIPNSAWIRENVGFKNVSLSNVLSAKAAGEEITFIAPDERALYEEWESKSFAVQVANHELLGHGTGKLMNVDAAGKPINFDGDSLVNPLTGSKAEGAFYGPGETYNSKIGPISSSMEECRAEAVACFLADNREIQKVFGFTSNEDCENLHYFTFVGFLRAGIRALEFYDPKTKKQGQAHMQARLGICNWLFKHGLAKLEKVYDKDGKLVDAYARADRAKILAEGKAVMGELLVQIQTYKSLGLAKEATAFYTELTQPSDEWVNELRPVVLAKKLPRKVFVQPNMFLTAAGEVELREYPVTIEGVIESFVERAL